MSRRIAFSLAAVAALQPAVAAPPAAPISVELTVVGGPQLNPNSQGRPSPVVVRLFDLTASNAFEAANYTAVFERTPEALAHQIVKQEEFIVRPGDIQKHDRELPPQVTALGIAAAFRDLEHGAWHLTVTLRPGRRNFVLLDLDQDTLRLVSVDPSP